MNSFDFKLKLKLKKKKNKKTILINTSFMSHTLQVILVSKLSVSCFSSDLGDIIATLICLRMFFKSSDPGDKRVLDYKASSV